MAVYKVVWVVHCLYTGVTAVITIEIKLNDCYNKEKKLRESFIYIYTLFFINLNLSNSANFMLFDRQKKF